MPALGSKAFHFCPRHQGITAQSNPCLGFSTHNRKSRLQRIAIHFSASHHNKLTPLLGCISVHVESRIQSIPCHDTSRHQYSPPHLSASTQSSPYRFQSRHQSNSSQSHLSPTLGSDPMKQLNISTPLCQTLSQLKVNRTWGGVRIVTYILKVRVAD